MTSGCRWRKMIGIESPPSTGEFCCHPVCLKKNLPHREQGGNSRGRKKSLKGIMSKCLTEEEEYHEGNGTIGTRGIA
jgi:hypothetical protein